MTWAQIKYQSQIYGLQLKELKIIFFNDISKSNQNCQKFVFNFLMSRQHRQAEFVLHSEITVTALMPKPWSIFIFSNI